MSMHPADLGFLVVRLVMVGLCLVACIAALRRLGEPMGNSQRPRAMLGLIALVLAIGVALAVHDVWDNLLVRRDQAILLGSWLWLIFDLAVPLLALRALQVMRQRDEAIARLAAISVTDPLTGLANRRGFEERALPALAAARRAGQPVSLVMLDLDRFKAINDGFGHPAGDDVLRGTAQALLASLRAEDVAGRLGGEEFAVLLPNTDPPGAAQFAERFRARLRAAVRHPDPARAVTASAGVAGLGVASPAEALAAAIAAADVALYAAKQGGRDRVALAGGDDKAARPVA